MTIVFRRQNSRFRKRFSKIGLRYNVAVPPKNTAREYGATEMAEKYAKCYPNNNQQYAVSLHSEDMPYDVSALMDLVTLTFDFLTLKRGCESI